MDNNLNITLVVPCYNEEANIQKGVLDKIGNYTEDHDAFLEVLIVDDGSTDRSNELILEEYVLKYEKLRLIQKAHQGKAYAVIEGIKQAKGDYVMFMDIDLATPIEETEKLIKQINAGYDIVIGSRTRDRKGAPLSRKILAYGFITVRNILIGLKNIKDTQCGFKIFKRDAALHIIEKLRLFKSTKKISGSSVTAGFDLEFLFLAAKFGYKIKEIPVEWKHVETKNVNFFKDAIETMKDILRMKFYDLTHKYV